jgi:hypothetical protein
MDTLSKAVLETNTEGQSLTTSADLLFHSC